MGRAGLWKRLGAILLAIGVFLVVRNQVKVYLNRQASQREIDVRRLMFDELRPVPLVACQLERFGEANDGGYLVCANLLGGVRAAYSYGISGYDQWGCDASMRLGIPTHQYDCFNTTVPSCPRGRTIFHPECVGGVARTEQGRPFDTIANQFARNGDGGNHMLVKIDVEGAEWESFEVLPDEVLQRIDQLVVEFHDIDGERSLAVVRRLKRFFHVAHFHANNAWCVDFLAPFTSWAYEVTFVSQMLDRVDSSRSIQLPHPADARNDPTRPDCQPAKRP